MYGDKKLVHFKIIVQLAVTNFSLPWTEQIKQERKSEAFEEHWILPQRKRNAMKERKTCLKIRALFSFFHTIWQRFSHHLFFFALVQMPCIYGNKKFMSCFIIDQLAVTSFFFPLK